MANKTEQELLEALGCSSVEELAAKLAAAEKKASDSEERAAAAEEEAKAAAVNLATMKADAQAALQLKQATPNEEPRVPVFIPINPARKHDLDITVGVNGKVWKIKRGVQVDVPESVAEVIRHSDEQIAESMENAARLAYNG